MWKERISMNEKYGEERQKNTTTQNGMTIEMKLK